MFQAALRFTLLGFSMALALPAHGQSMGEYEVVGFESLPWSYMDQQSLALDSPEAVKAITDPSWSEESQNFESKLQEKSHPHRKGWKWIPTGASADPVSLECHPLTIEEAILKHRGSDRQRSELVHNYFEKCKKMLWRNNPKGFSALITLALTKYKMSQNAKFKPFKLKLANGETIDVILGLQDDRPRPTVIIKCGLFCNGEMDTGSLKQMTMHLFDESPFNILLMANHTGPQNIKDNGRITVGGFYEGQEVMSVGKWLKKASPWRHQVSALHFMGISLGGSAAFYTSMYNDHNPLSDNEKVYNSVIAYCPAVDIKGTMDVVYGKGIRSLFFGILTWLNLRKVFSFLPVLRDLFPGKRPKPHEMPEKLGLAAVDFLSKLKPRQYLAPFNRMGPVDNLDKFWARNNFLNYSDDIETPTFVMASKNDWIVPWKPNSRNLERKHYGANFASGNINVVSLEDGNHCGPDAVYGWATVSSILRAYILSYSGENRIESRPQQVTQMALPSPRLKSDQVHVQQEWTTEQGQSHATLTYKYWGRRNGPYECGGARGSAIRRSSKNKKPFTSGRECYMEKSYEIAYSDLPFSLATPQSKTESESLTRWLNSRVQVHSSEGPMVGNRSAPDRLIWYAD